SHFIHLCLAFSSEIKNRTGNFCIYFASNSTSYSAYFSSETAAKLRYMGIHH
ncbi:MAG: hypothetical protein ACI8R0_002253, partial [Alteromonadales bacterium]